MKRSRGTLLLSLAVAGLLGALRALPASGNTVVSPSIYASEDARDLSNSFWPTTARANFIFHASEFANLPVGGSLLSEISMRPDASASQGSEFAFGDIEISVAVTPMAPSEISLTYADNIGAAAAAPIVVYRGPWSAMVTSERTQRGEPRPFELSVPLQNLFDYNPADGNLLVDWVFRDPISTLAAVDIELSDAASDVHGHVWGGDANAPSASDLFGVTSVMTELTFVPEPSGSMLAVTAVFVCGLAGRRRRVS